jgi:2-polyprenyl-6-methoxyphenol hydroxylase-like FAD-dependent oxidoreductase
VTGPGILVVGAGPTGLVLACTLRRLGVDCRVVDRRAAGGAEPKALVLWSGALEALRRTGIDAELRRRALALTGASYWSKGRRLGEVRFGGLPGTAFPGPLCVPQPVVEELLRARLGELGGAVEWGTELVEAQRSGDSFQVRLRSGAGDERIEVRRLVGADGTHSRVREALGIGYRGRTYERTFLLGDGRLTGPAPADQAQYHLHPDGVLVVVPLPGGGHRVFFDVAADQRDDPPDSAELQGLLDARGPAGVRIAETWWTSRFRVHARLADRFRDGDAFLAGDAAHCHGPAGGQGLNTGVQDGYDLGWKLASVVRGAPERLLDSYAAERRPASARAVRGADQQTRLWMTRAPVARWARDLVMRRLFRSAVPEKKLIPQLAQLDLDHSGSPAVADLAGPAGGSAPAAGRRMPDAAVTGGATLHDYLAAGRYVVLVAGGDPAAETVAAAARWTTGRGVRDVVDVLWLRPPNATAPGPAGADLVTEVAPERFTGGGAWAALIRPDGVVAVRAGLDGLGEILDRLPQRLPATVG